MVEPKNVKEINTIYENLYSVTYVPQGVDFWENRLLLKIINLFKFDNLPSTMNEIALIKSLYFNGFVGVVNDEKYGLVNVDGSLHGVTVYKDWFSYFTISNPKVRGNALEIGKECEIIYLNGTHTGIYELIQRYARLLADSDSTYASQLYILRRPNFFNAPDTKTADNVKVALKVNRIGLDSVILGKDLLNEVSSIPQKNYADTGVLTDMITARNNIYNMFLREIGIKCLDEKKERVITDETSVNNQLLEVSIFEMLTTIKGCVKNVNTLYRTTITCDLSPEWKKVLEPDPEPDPEPDTEPNPEPDPEPEPEKKDEPEKETVNNDNK